MTTFLTRMGAKPGDIPGLIATGKAGTWSVELAGWKIAPGTPIFRSIVAPQSEPGGGTTYPGGYEQIFIYSPHTQGTASPIQ